MAKLEVLEEKCANCGKTVPMHYIVYDIKEYDAGGYEQQKHTIALRQCSFCKMIQPQED